MIIDFETYDEDILSRRITLCTYDPPEKGVMVGSSACLRCKWCMAEYREERKIYCKFTSTVEKDEIVEF